MTREDEAIKSLQYRPDNNFYCNIFLYLLNKFPILAQIYSRVSPDLPSDLKTTEEFEDANGKPVVNCFNYDEGHAGRYSDPSHATQGGSISFNYVQEAASDYLTKNLTFPSSDNNQRHVVTFSPGLNTLHEPAEGETTTPQRLLHYIRILLHISMNQIHTGTSFDQGDIRVDLSSNVFLKIILRLVLTFIIPPGGDIPYFDEQDKNILIFSARSIDSIQTGLSYFNLIDTPLKVCFRDLLDSTYGDDGKSICIAAYSRASVELYAALKKHISDSKDIKNESEEECFNRLRRNVTILTVGSAARGYPDGPAYIHLASWQDSLTMSMGVNGNNSDQAGRDAVFLNFDSPLNETCGDNHNFGTVSGQYLSLILQVNEVSTIREIWEKGQTTEGVKVPPNLEETLPAAISLTNGLNWLWNPEEALKDVPEKRFPSQYEAEKILGIHIGKEYAETLRKVNNC